VIPFQGMPLVVEPRPRVALRFTLGFVVEPLRGYCRRNGRGSWILTSRAGGFILSSCSVCACTHVCGSSTEQSACKHTRYFY